MKAILSGITAISFYSVTTLVLALRLSRKTNDQDDGKFAILLPASIAILLHATLIQQLLLSDLGFNFGFFYSLTLTAWLISFLMLVSSFFASTENMGIILFPISILSILLAIVFTPKSSTFSELDSNIQIHIFLSLLAYSTLSLAALQAILVAFQNHLLHNRKPNYLTSLFPPLQTMEDMMFKMIGLGFSILSFALLSGFLFADKWFTHKIVFSIIAWAVFAVLLFGRIKAGWRGPSAVKWVLSGMATLMIGFFGSKLVLELILQRT